MIQTTAWLTLALTAGVTAAHADTASEAPAIDAKLAAKLKRAGWGSASVLLRTPRVTVLQASKGKTWHVLIASAAGALVDGGFTTELAGVTEETSMLSDLVELHLESRTPRANEGFDATSKIWLVREDGSVACKLDGPSSSSSGKACGSGGWTSVTLRRAGDAKVFSIDVTTQHSGTWSVADPSGVCVNRSPVRSGPLRTRYEVPAKGTCKKVPVPPTAKVLDDGLGM